ncbi:MAG: ABC transporter ATP-binding protein [Clostridiales bacterium]|nr:ABC transporter ATP-binding protein [Clostridiales bacterium]
MKQTIKNILKKYWILIIVEFILIGLNTYILTVPSKILGKIIDLLNNVDGNKSEIIVLIISLLLISILLVCVRTGWKIIENTISRNLVKNLRDKLYQKMLTIKMKEIDSIKNGELMSYFVSDIKEIRVLVSKVLTTIIRFIFSMLMVGISIYFASNVQLLGLCIIPMTISLIIVLVMTKKLERDYNKSKNEFTKLSEFVQESTDSIRTTKAYCGYKKQYNEFVEKNKNLKSANINVIKNDATINAVVNMGMGISIVLFIIYGSKLVVEDVISLGDFVAINGYMVLIQKPITWIPWLIKHFKKIKVSYRRLNKVFNLPEEDTDFNYIKKVNNLPKEDIASNYINEERLNGNKVIKLQKENSVSNYINERKTNINKVNNLLEEDIISKHINEEKLNGNIEIKGLTYTYEGSTDKVLEDINISLNSGKSLGIIGKIGSGKTTLMNLLLKLYNVPNNTIFIDGKDLNNIKTDVVRNNICYITQDNFLFSTTLKENINLFKDIYDEDDVIKSTKSSLIYSEIEAMKDGINTIIGEKGIDLSGGQKQRVVISRAFLDEKNIIIFDDTFSALDNKTEKEVLKNIKELTKNKVCIIISNRISDIKHCDEIVVLDKGKIIERGIHKELLENKKQYYEFYREQAEKKNILILE